MTLTDEAAANLSASVAMLRDALEPLIKIVADRCSGLSAEDWAALEDARQAIAQTSNAEFTGIGRNGVPIDH